MYVTPPHIFYCISTHFNSFWTLFDMGLKNMLLTDIYLKFNIYIYIYIHGTWSRTALGLQTCQHVALLSHQQTQCRLSNETDFPPSGPGYQWSFRNSLDQMTYLAWPIRKSIGTAVAETLPIYVRYSTGPKIRHYFVFRCPGPIRYKCLYIYIYIWTMNKVFFQYGYSYYKTKRSRDSHTFIMGNPMLARWYRNNEMGPGGTKRHIFFIA